MDGVDCLNIDCWDCVYFFNFNICGYAYYVTDDEWQDPPDEAPT
jgi:hypothetical protein